ncbi:hypothetical protein CDD81_192 [Ophiocordyceps australis]|uniref:Uncharacterized protein n=1 Tax=Ophiocordyceps australis TaxID=1399860 RepID=A0A2C5XBH2_9HYPO|nr:hypothetical protein CDD81_192 [Ophiocordyceps australis]
MKLTALVPSLLAAGVAADDGFHSQVSLPRDVESSIEVQRQDLEQNLQRNFRLSKFLLQETRMRGNWSKIQNSDCFLSEFSQGKCEQESDTQKPAAPLMRGSKFGVGTYYQLVDQYLNASSAVNMTVFYQHKTIGKVEHNHGPYDVAHQVEESSFDSQGSSSDKKEDSSTSHGWHAEAKFHSSGGFNVGFAHGEAGIEIGGGGNGQYGSGSSSSTSKHDSKSKSGSKVQTRQCKARHRCSFEIVSWYFRVSGYCKVSPMLRCGDKENRHADLCSASSNMACLSDYNVCNTTSGAAQHWYEPCEFEFPLSGKDGLQLWDELYIATPLQSASSTVITGYYAGCYLLDDDYCFSPYRKGKRYYKMESKAWEDGAGTPPNVTAYIHTKPTITSISSSGFILDTYETYNPSNKETPYCSEFLKACYNRPGPLPDWEAAIAEYKKEAEQEAAKKETAAQASAPQTQPSSYYRRKKTYSHSRNKKKKYVNNRSGRHSTDNRGANGGTYIGQVNGKSYGRASSYIGQDTRGGGGGRYKDSRGSRSRGYSNSNLRGAYFSVGGGSRGKIKGSSNEHVGDVGSFANTGSNQGGSGIGNTGAQRGEEEETQEMSQDIGQSTTPNKFPLPSSVPLPLSFQTPAFTDSGNEEEEEDSAEMEVE